jgi:hypothetical protein
MHDSLKRMQGPAPSLDRITEPGDSRSIVKDDGPSQATSLMVANMIRKGLSPVQICRKVGISIKKYNGWLDKDPEESSPLERIFQATVGEALSEATGKAMDCVMKAIEDGNDARAAWFLERTNPEQFGVKSRVEHSGVDGGPIELQAVQRMSHAEKLAELERLRAKNAEGVEDEEGQG